MWAHPDVCRLVADNPGSVADNVGYTPPIVAVNLGNFTPMFAGRAPDVCRPLQLEAQKIEREAKPYIGFAFYREVEGLRGWLADRVQAFKEIDWRNSMRDQFDRIREKAPDLQADFIAHARAYARDFYPELQQEQEPSLEQGIEHDR